MHGYVDLCSSVAEAVDSWVVQRLRWVRQTGLASYVYHGMEHSRFNHSLGAAHLAREVLGFVAGNTQLYYSQAGGRELAEALRAAVEVFQLAALVHDVGHLPFSHSSETGVQEARSIYRVKGFEELPLRHEEYTYALLPRVARVAASVEPVFTGELLRDLEFILRGSRRGGEMLSLCAAEVLHKLLVSGLDVDRMDYLIRDSLYAGVRYGVFDVDRLVRVIVATPLLAEEDSEGLRSMRLRGDACSIAVLDKGLSIVEAFMLARFYMFSEVYLHRVVEAYNSVYARLLALLALEGKICVDSSDGDCRLVLPSPQRLAALDPEAETHWRLLDDNTILTLAREVALGRLPAEEPTRRLASMLLERRHPKGYRAVESEKLWVLMTSYMQGQLPEELKELAPMVEELLDIQRDNPLVHIRPLHADTVSLKGELLVYDRRRGDTVPLGSYDNPVAERLRRLADRERISLYRVAVFAPSEDEAEKIYRRLLELDGEARRFFSA